MTDAVVEKVARAIAQFIQALPFDEMPQHRKAVTSIVLWTQTDILEIAQAALATLGPGDDLGRGLTVIQGVEGAIVSALDKQDAARQEASAAMRERCAAWHDEHRAKLEADLATDCFNRTVLEAAIIEHKASASALRTLPIDEDETLGDSDG